MNQRVLNLLENDWILRPDFFAQKISNGKWKPYPYLVKISKLITNAVVNGGGRLIFTLPPRHGKSELISKYTPPWFLNLFPNKNVILASYSDELASHWGRSVRNIIQGNRLLDTHLSEDSTAAHRFSLKQGGSMLTAGVGGPITGRGGDLMIIDDPVKNWKDAKSPTIQAATIDWFNSTFYTRAESDTTIILLQTRWDENDLAGYLLAEHPGEWTLVNMPALAGDIDLLGRKPGEALCPQRYDSDRLLKIKGAVGSTIFDSLYQGEPMPAGGVKFKSDWIRHYRKKDLLDQNNRPIVFDMMILSWDLSFEGEKDSDWNVGQCWGLWNNEYYLVAQVRKQMKFIEQCNTFEGFAVIHPNYQAILLEKKANAAALIDYVKPRCLGIIEINPIESKEVRADFVTPLWEAGRVRIPHPDEEPWVEDFLKEVLKFPKSKNKDQVDTMTQALRWFSERREPRLRIIGGNFQDDDDD